MYHLAIVSCVNDVEHTSSCYLYETMLFENNKYLQNNEIDMLKWKSLRCSQDLKIVVSMLTQ